MQRVGSIAASRSWHEGQVVDDDLQLAEIPDAIRNHDLIWVDLLNPTPNELAAIAEEFGIPESSTEDALAPLERPKVVRHETHLFFTAYATSMHLQSAEDRLRTSRISGIVLPNALVTIRLDNRFDMNQVLAHWQENADLLTHGSGALLYGLLDVIVDGHFETIQQLDEIVEALEEELFAEQRTGRAFARNVFLLRKDLVRLRRLVLPMREVVSALLRHRASTGTTLDLWYDDLYDHVLRASEWTESLRDMVTSLFETNLSLQDARLNEIMKKLAAWAAIIAVPTAITGWFGQNLPYPGFAATSGMWMSAGLILALSGTLWIVFRRRGWL